MSSQSCQPISSTVADRTRRSIATLTRGSANVESDVEGDVQRVNAAWTNDKQAFDQETTGSTALRASELFSATDPFPAFPNSGLGKRLVA